MKPIDKVNLLAGVPSSVRSELIDTLTRIAINFRERRWEPSELNGGKLCEIVYSIVRGEADGQILARPVKPKNMVDACRDLEKEVSLPRSMRIQVPRVLMALYEIRNNRGVGHVGGDVNPNHMDAIAVLYMSKWLVAELVRFYHKVDTVVATEAVDAIVERELQVVWPVDGRKRVLIEKATLRDKTLLLLYGESVAIPEDQIRDWVEASNSSSYRRDVLKKAHKAKLIEYNALEKNVRLSPLGVRYVEENLSLIA
ncbi:hypothetical protein AB0J40_21715 [Amycolatopsis sp. NPDC049691]|uniref:hypothetical protein n=1 Tax=Amycolatopsis sp. NPDC049691 TaxID=3155155 RepID=UPI00341394C6